MRDLNDLRGAENEGVVHVIYDSVEKIKSRLDSDTYCDLMNALLVLRERLNVSPVFMGEDSDEVPGDEAVSPLPNLRQGPIRTEHDREERILAALHQKHEIERDMIDFRRSYRQGRDALMQSHANVMKIIDRLQRLPLEPVRDEGPIVL
ncbi:hypothetical protein DSLPV1_208 [Dishui lake phycodnavirus 1]|uniref:hypothetical protein n=1 Tax=Dishui lake phycodnavirus 1 TaxID=2079134 RepID=UPI000CD6966E|nr:hypothetical protein C5Y57_gp190 [Dishui lake phycodnavirus 1]AUT19179.1 hypothetical protein DSLPV1_208 [Dishui lake phycodnavirus 1]